MAAPSTPVRADAARNRLAILEAARRLLACGRPGELTMDAVACEAGVGKGTLFRRFGDRSELFRALLDDGERALQDAVLAGPAPLGPGTPPRERLAAFGEALLDLLETQGDLIAAAETGRPGARLTHPVYAAHRMHVVALLTQADISADVDYVSDALLAALSAELVLHQRHVQGRALAELKLGWRRLVAAVAA
jgi:AcrR family transcriptional regulator